MTDQASSEQTRTSAAESRINRFATDVAGLDIPVPTSTGETRMLIVGILFVVAGFVAILVGYWGASGTAAIADQMPYMLSGGAVGLALVVIGGFLIGRYTVAHMLRFWLALLVIENREQTDRLIAALEASSHPKNQ